MKKLAAIRNAQTLHERLALAEDKKPGTAFDAIFDTAIRAIRELEQRPNLNEHAQQDLAHVGLFFAKIFRDGNSAALDDLPKAFNIWRHHTPNPDVIRAEIIALLLDFPPGKPRLDQVGDEIVERELWPALSSREIQERLERKGYQIVDPETTARQIRRVASELKYPLASASDKSDRKKAKPVRAS